MKLAKKLQATCKNSQTTTKILGLIVKIKHHCFKMLKIKPANYKCGVYLFSGVIK